MKWLFIYAHMDDETILSYGFMRKLVDEGNDVNLIAFCGKSRIDDPIWKKQKRIQMFKQNTCFLKTVSLFNFNDLTLNENVVQKHIRSYLNEHQPNAVVTHSSFDNHFEHRIISQQTLLASRIKNDFKCIRRLLFSSSPTYSQTYCQFGVYQPNLFVDISKYMNDKVVALENYAKIDEIPKGCNDIRGVESIVNLNRQHGLQISANYAESYQQIFEII